MFDSEEDISSVCSLKDNLGYVSAALNHGRFIAKDEDDDEERTDGGEDTDKLE